MQVTHEEITHATLIILATGPVTAVGNDQQIKVFLRANQCVHVSHGGLWWNIVIQFTDHEEQVALEFSRVFNVGALRILRPDRVAHPLLVPRRLVHAVVVATGVRNRSFVELRME